MSVSPTGADLVDPMFKLSGEIAVPVSADTDLVPWTLRPPYAVLVGMQRHDVPKG